MVEHNGLIVKDGVYYMDPITQMEYDEGVRFLLEGDYEKGWPLYEKSYGPFPVERWQGDYTKCVVLYNGQGFGDCMQFLRYMPMLKERCEYIEFVFDPSLEKLVTDSFPYMRPVPFGASRHKGSHRYPITSLASLFKTTVYTIPQQIPYLKAGKIQTNKKIGVCWETKAPRNARGGHPTSKNIPKELLAPLFSRSDVMSLDWSDLRTNNWAETAAIVNSLELVITGDFAVAHLAGALGIPVWIMLLYHNDWRWLKNRTDSPWYPTATLFRQPRFGDWEPVTREIVSRIQ